MAKNRAIGPVMLDLAKLIHEAIGIESPRTFIIVFAVVGAILFGTLGWLVDKGYRVKLRESARVASTADLGKPLVVEIPPPPKAPEPTAMQSASPAPTSHGKHAIKREAIVQPIPKKTAPPSQVMKDSPGGIQAGRDVNINVNADRTLTAAAAAMMTEGLRANPCAITVGVLGSGGEPSQLADQILMAVRTAVPDARGVNHGIGFAPFYGIQLKYSPVNTPTPSVQAIARTLATAQLQYVLVEDQSQPDGAVYIYVGYKP